MLNKELIEPVVKLFVVFESGQLICAYQIFLSCVLGSIKVKPIAFGFLLAYKVLDLIEEYVKVHQMSLVIVDSADKARVRSCKAVTVVLTTFKGLNVRFPDWK